MINSINTMTANACAKIQTQVYCLKNQVANMERDERGITAIEYAIMGVAMASALLFIFDKGGFLTSLKGAWDTMSTKINGAGNILKESGSK